jgi:hypothetical protein
MQAYGQAIEEQADLLRHVRTIGQTPQATSRYADHLYKGVIDSYQPALKHMMLTLETAAPFYWDVDLCSVLEAAAPTMPDWELHFENLPAQSGFINFGRALHLPMPPKETITEAIANGRRRADLPLDYRLDMTGMAWSVVEPGQCFISTILRTTTRLNGEPGLMHITDEGQSMQGIIAVLAGVRRNEALYSGVDAERDRLHNTLMATRAELQVRYIAAALDFINQPLLTTRKRLPPHRVIRKRMERAGRVVQDVEVIELRRKQYLSVDEPDEAPTDREYRHRWFVGMATGGYWQRYHTRERGTIRRLILPYMKLADRTDLPIKQPRQTVYVVDR